MGASLCGPLLAEGSGTTVPGPFCVLVRMRSATVAAASRSCQDDMADRDAGHPQNTQYHTGYILGEVLMSVRHALLALLSEGPKYGLQLRQEFESRTGEVWPLNVGQVYTTLQRLERDGLVESDGDGGRSRKRYKITSAGSEELAGWLRTPPELVPPPRDELVIKVLVALQIPGSDIREIVQ